MSSTADGRNEDVRIRGSSLDELMKLVGSGDQLAVARLLTEVERAGVALRPIAAALAPTRGRAHVVGLTGAPGVGKSTTTAALVSAYRAEQAVVGVLAVDPSSPFSGGALLGDRIRMGEHATDPAVFIRSMATRGHLGGLSAAVPHALRVLDAAGCQIALVETVGVGQAEVEIADLADTTIVMLAPGMGDGIQAAKAGILEVADVLVVNKADTGGARAAATQLLAMQGYAARRPGSWIPPVLTISAARRQGIDELVEAVARHRTWLASSGELTGRRRRRAGRQIAAIALGVLRERIGEVPGERSLTGLADEVATGRLDPFSAADRLLDHMSGGASGAVD